MEILGLFGELGSIFLLILAALAFISPIMIYLIQRNTYQNREELRLVNANLEALHHLIGNQAGVLLQGASNDSSTIAAESDQPIGNTVTMKCEHCGRLFKYGIKHSGTHKPCPGCNKSILLK